MLYHLPYRCSLSRWFVTLSATSNISFPSVPRPLSLWLSSGHLLTTPCSSRALVLIWLHSLCSYPFSLLGNFNNLLFGRLFTTQLRGCALFILLQPSTLSWFSPNLVIITSKLTPSKISVLVTLLSTYHLRPSWWGLIYLPWPSLDHIGAVIALTLLYITTPSPSISLQLKKLWSENHFLFNTIIDPTLCFVHLIKPPICLSKPFTYFELNISLHFFKFIFLNLFLSGE